MLIVAPPPAAQPDNSAHSEDSRSTSASDHSIPRFLLVSREKLNNFADFSDFRRRWQTVSKDARRCPRLGGTSGGF